MTPNTLYSQARAAAYLRGETYRVARRDSNENITIRFISVGNSIVGRRKNVCSTLSHHQRIMNCIRGGQLESRDDVPCVHARAYSQNRTGLLGRNTRFFFDGEWGTCLLHVIRYHYRLTALTFSTRKTQSEIRKSTRNTDRF